MRFYERQFITRSHINRDILSRFDALLDDCFSGDSRERDGLPTVRYCAEQLCLSPNYFGDLIKKETGKTAQEYIRIKLVEAAKNRILDPRQDYKSGGLRARIPIPQHFSRLFKKTVGHTPNEYRSSME